MKRSGVLCWYLSLLLLGWTSGGAADPPSRFADFDGVKVHYLDRGEGSSALVFVHGWGCDLTVWREQLELDLAQRALFIDLPGHGKSDKPSIEYTMEFLASGIEAVLGDAGVEEVVVIGHSNGVPVTRQFYRRNRERIRALVLVEGSLRPLTDDPARWEQMVAPLRSEDYLEAGARMVPTNMDEALQEEVRTMMQATPQHVLVSTLEAVGDPAIWGDDPVDVETLVVLAASPFWTDEYEAFVRQLVPAVDYRVIEGVSHFLQMESPGRFNEQLEEFLSGQSLGGS